MEKKYKRNDQIDKKNDNKIKDRGDLKTVIKNDSKTKKDNTTQLKIIYPDGDSRKVSTSPRPEKHKLKVLIKLPTEEENKNKEDIKPKEDNKLKEENKPKLKLQNELDKELPIKKPVDLKRVRERYTMKLKSASKIPHAKAVDVKSASDDQSKKKPEEAPQCKDKEKANDLTKSKKKPEEFPQAKEREKASDSANTSDDAKEKKEQTATKKKPIIKTIMTKNGSMRVYKAVTFGEQKGRTPLQIKIPNDTVKKQNSSKMTDTSSLKSKLTVSRVSIKDNTVIGRRKTQRKRERRHRHLPSRECSVAVIRSPPTEVARWAPASIDKHTKPYYEAWVNTTLAAITKNTEKAKLMLQNQAILDGFHRALERPITPELIYSNYADERYTGRIKITQR